MKRYIPVIIFVLILPFGFVATYDLLLYRIGVMISSPVSFQFYFPTQRKFTGIPPNSYHYLRWSDDGAIIHLYGSNPDYTKKDLPGSILNIDASSGKLIDITEQNSENSSNLTYDLINAIQVKVGNETRDKCLHGDVSVRENYLVGDNYWIDLYQGETLTATFKFSPATPGYMPGSRGIRFVTFSPKCDFVTLTIEGWSYYEGEGQSELWLLDVIHKTLKPVVIGRWPLVKLADYPVQSVRPDWSPDGKRLVFGDDLYGLEVYDLATTMRTRLASAGHSGYFPEWSPSGKWIAASTSLNLFSSIVVLSDNGRFFTFGKNCNHILAYEWSPVKDQLAFICIGNEWDNDELWVWDFGTERKDLPQ